MRTFHLGLARLPMLWEQKKLSLQMRKCVLFGSCEM